LGFAALAVSRVIRNGHKFSFFTKEYSIMKKTLIALTLLASFAAFAQDSSSTSGSNSNSGAAAGANAIGNQNASQSGSSSTSGAASGSVSGAIGNAITVNVPPAVTLSGPNAGVQSLGADGIATNRVQSVVSGGTTSTLAGGTNSTDNIKYSGTIDNKASGGYNNTSTSLSQDNVNYSGTQTIKNVPGIAMSGPASGPCTGNSGGVGIAGPGFGVGLNGAKVDDGCTVRENTRVLGQLYQSLDAANPAKAEAQAALIEGMMVIRNMNAKIGGDYAQPAPKQAAAQVVQPAPVASLPPIRTVAAAPSEPTDPYVRARMGLPAQ
jgi:hypothetical protein